MSAASSLTIESSSRQIHIAHITRKGKKILLCLSSEFLHEQDDKSVTFDNSKYAKRTEKQAHIRQNFSFLFTLLKAHDTCMVKYIRHFLALPDHPLLRKWGRQE